MNVIKSIGKQDIVSKSREIVFLTLMKREKVQSKSRIRTCKVIFLGSFYVEKKVGEL